MACVAPVAVAANHQRLGVATWAVITWAEVDRIHRRVVFTFGNLFNGAVQLVNQAHRPAACADEQCDGADFLLLGHMAKSSRLFLRARRVRAAFRA